MPARKAWGLDIGQHAIRLAEVERVGGEVVLSDYAIRSFGVSPEDPEHQAKLAEVLEELLDEKAVGRAPVYVSVPGQATFFRDFPLPAISSAKLHEIVSYEARQQIPYPLEEVLWDFHQQARDEEGTELSIALVCSRRDIVQELLDTLDSFDLNVAGIQAGPVALANFLLYDQPPEGTTLVLDSGAGATDFLILHEGSFMLRSIGVAGMDISKALMDKFSLPYEEAERLKTQMAESKQADRVFQVVLPILRNLTGEVQRSMGYYKSLYRGIRIANCICAGGMFLLPNVDQFLADDLGMPVAGIQEYQLLEVDEDLDETALVKDRVVLGTAVGLALQGVGEAPIDINLLPPEIQRRHQIRQKVPYAVVSVALLVLMMVVSLITGSKSSTRWDDLLKEMTRVVGKKGERVTMERKLSRAIEAHAPEEAVNEALACLAPSRGDLLRGTGRVHEAFHAIGDARNKPLRTAEAIAKRTEELFADSEIQEGLAKQEEHEPEKLKAFILPQCRRRAERLLRRRRRLFIESLEAKAYTQLWFSREEGDGDEKVRVLYSPGPADALRKRLGDDDDDDDDDDHDGLTPHPLQVVYIDVTGYSVSTPPRELPDVDGLEPELAKRLGEQYHILEVVRKDSKMHNLPVIEYDFSGQELDKPTLTSGGESVGASAADAAASGSSREVKWGTVPERIIPLDVRLLFLPQRAFSEMAAPAGREGDGQREASSVPTKIMAGGRAQEQPEDQSSGGRRRRRR